MKRIFLHLIILLTTALGTAQAQQYWAGDFSSVPPKREVRAVWLTTIGGLDWPHTYSHTHTTQQRQKQELRDILDQLKRAGINTVLLQTRVRGTVIYPSALEPWDGCMSGTPGSSPGYDPLAFAIDECHKRGMELHAWIVSIPLGKWTGKGSATMRRQHPELVMRIDQEAYMRPENAATAQYLEQLCEEIVSHYDIDGIHLDYIRYPENLRLTISREEARSNISRIVSSISQRVKALKPWVKMSCSPIGKRDDLNRYTSRGWNAYDKGCQDVERWLASGWMDQIYPMMYFRGDNFFPFAADWKERSHGHTVVAGLGIYFLSPKEGNWPAIDIQREMNVSRQMGLGHAYFRSKFFTDNTKGIYTFAKDYFDIAPALTPEMTWQRHTAPTPPSAITIHQEDGRDIVAWKHEGDDTSHGGILYNVYASRDKDVDTGDMRNLIAQRVSANNISVGCKQHDLYYAVTAMDRYGTESAAATDPRAETATPAFSTPLLRNQGNSVELPPRDKANDARFLVVETLTGIHVATRPYHQHTVLNVERLPNGVYVLRSVNKKGITHRLGWMEIRKDEREE